MSKLQGYIYRLLCAAMLLLFLQGLARAQYRLHIVPVDRDSLFVQTKLGLKMSFVDREACLTYINAIPATLQAKGYPAASVDSLYADTAMATIQLFVGELYQLTYINLMDIDKRTLEQVGWNERMYFNKPLNISQLQKLQENMLVYYENNGYPFAKIKLDSIGMTDGRFSATLKVDKGPLYKIDSIHVIGTAKISNSFLQHYLDIANGSIYRKATLQNISSRLLELPYLQEQHPWSLTMLGTGSILNLHLEPKKASQVNVLVGFLPSSNQQSGSSKLLLTGEANINLRNALGNGETIGVNWQQLQVKSPRLNLSFQQPYLFGTSFGINTAFDLFKKDSSFVNLNFLLGVQYHLSATQTGQVFVQNFRTNLLTVDTQRIKNTKKLPDEIDVSTVNLGVDYTLNTTNYRLNPRKGNELQLVVTAGTRKIRQNNVIVKLADPAFSYEKLYDTVNLGAYQFKVNAKAAHYFPIGRQSAVKAAVNGGWLQSPTIYRNELFQIGGYKLLRGFDEESIYASQYAVATAEYRFLLSLNSYLFSFADAGWVANKSSYANTKNTFIGAGIGLALETQAGIFNISFAAGKRNDLKFDIRQSKIHLAYVNYF